MPQLNFNLLAQEGPQNVYQGFMQGQQIRNQLAQQQQQRQLADIQLQNALREQRMADEEAAAWQSNAGNPQAVLQDLQRRGLSKQAMTLQGQLIKQQADKLVQQKTQHDLVKTVANRVFSNPENAEQLLTAFGNQTGIDMRDDLAEIAKLGGNLESVKKWAQGITIEADKLLPKFAEFGTPGGGKVVGTTDPATGQFIAKHVLEPRLTPSEAAHIKNEGLRLGLEGRRVNVLEENARRDATAVAHTLTDEAGNVTLLNKFGQVVQPQDAPGKPVVIKGKPSATFAKARNQREQLGRDLDMAIAELKDITKEGGLIDKSTGSGLGSALDVSAAFFGKTTEGAVAAGKLKPIADLALKMVPRFEGPQSDKDTQSYKEAAGQLADTRLPSKLRKEAGKTVLRLMQNRKGQFATQEMAAEGTAAGGGVDTSNPLLK